MNTTLVSVYDAKGLLIGRWTFDGSVPEIEAVAKTYLHYVSRGAQVSKVRTSRINKQPVSSR